MKSCEVCKEEQHKYKCPSCRTKYCSVACFKRHKDGACNPVGKEDQVTAYKQAQSEKEADGVASPEREMEDLEDSDRVTSEKLQKLGKSSDLKELLQNPHLQQMILHLDKTEHPHTDMENAMQEPIFTEFADACLKVIEPERYDNTDQSDSDSDTS